MRLLNQSITDLREQDVITRVLTHPHDRGLVLNIKGLDSDGRIYQDVARPKTRGRMTGDLDMLVVPTNAAEQATAIQVKRFPIRVDKDGSADARADHLDELFDKGAEQANSDERMGFFQVYLWLFVVIDTREQNGGRYSYDGPDSKLRARIDQAVSLSRLDARVGVIKFAWVQGMDMPPFECSTGGGSLIRLARSEAQPPEITRWVTRASRTAKLLSPALIASSERFEESSRPAAWRRPASRGPRLGRARPR